MTAIMQIFGINIAKYSMRQRVSHTGGETKYIAVKEISYWEKLYPCSVRLLPARTHRRTYTYSSDELTAKTWHLDWKWLHLRDLRRYKYN